MAAVSRGIGFSLIGVGIWVTTCGYMGVDPIKTLIKIVQNPSQAAAIMRAGATPLSGTNASASSSSMGRAVVAYAEAQLGKPYKLGGVGPNSYDCSGLTQAAWASVGVKIPRGSIAQMSIGNKVSLKTDLQAGDLVFPSLINVILGDHVQIWAGDGSGDIIEAPYPGLNVRKRSPWGLPSGNSVRAVRPVPNIQGGSGTPGTANTGGYAY